MIQSLGLVRSRNKLNMFYLHFHSTNGCQTWKSNKAHYIRHHVSSCDKLELLNLPYQNAYGLQTCPFAEELWEAANPKVTWSHVGRVTNLKNHISVFARIITTKLGRMLTSGRMFRMQTLKSSPTCCFFLFFLLVSVSGWTYGSFFSIFDGLLLKFRVIKYSIDLKLSLWEHYMSCALEKVIIVEVNLPIQSWISNENLILYLRYLRN